MAWRTQVHAAGAAAGVSHTHDDATFYSTQPSNEVRVVVGRAACDVPDPPPPLIFGIGAGRSVTLSWTPSLGATNYTLVAGSQPGAQNVLVLPHQGHRHAGRRDELS